MVLELRKHEEEYSCQVEVDREPYVYIHDDVRVRYIAKSVLERRTEAMPLVSRVNGLWYLSVALVPRFSSL